MPVGSYSDDWIHWMGLEETLLVRSHNLGH
jgi:hypothetical protein